MTIVFLISECLLQKELFLSSYYFAAQKPRHKWHLMKLQKVIFYE